MCGTDIYIQRMCVHLGGSNMLNANRVLFSAVHIPHRKKVSSFGVGRGNLSYNFVITIPCTYSLTTLSNPWNKIIQIYSRKIF